MFSSFQTQVFQFFKEKIDPSKPVLLALSGGADSLSLFYLLLEFSKEHPVKWYVAHVDHGWRAESQQEAEALKLLSKQYGIEFYLHILNPKEMQGNLEACSREARLQFFKKIIKSVGAQGVILGHHLDDQAETVFMRIFEGARLACCSGIQPVSVFEETKLFRPLLFASKDEIVQWMKHKKISYFEDPTNYDAQFMRARLRAELFPFLRKSFGKEFRSSLISLGQEAMEMRDYFNGKYSELLQVALQSDCGSCFDFSQSLPEHSFELKELLRVIGERCDFYLNRYQLFLVSSLLRNNQANKFVKLSHKTLYLDRKRLFVLDKQPLFCEERVEGQKIGSWRVETKECKAEEIHTVKNSWRDVFLGDCSTLLPCDQEYSLQVLDLRQRRFPHGKVMANFLTEKKVPHLFSRFCPAVCIGGFVREDFLLGEKPLTKGRAIYMKLKRET